MPAGGRNDRATATTEPVRLPPGPRIPKPVQAIGFLVLNHGMFAALNRRYGGSVIRVNLPRNDHAVVISDPVLASYSWCKNAMNKYWYPFITRRWEKEDIVFLNWGYEEDPPLGLPLAPEDEPNRYWIQLYHRTASQAVLISQEVARVRGRAADRPRTGRPKPTSASSTA